MNWLAHTTNATRFDALMAHDATQNVVAAFGIAVVRKERGLPDRCPICSSYQLTTDFRPDLDIDPPYLTVCTKCNWVHHEADAPEGNECLIPDIRVATEDITTPIQVSVRNRPS